MPYPISIIKEEIINLDSSTSYQDIVNRLTEDLNKTGTEIEIKDTKMKLVRCIEFSSRTTSLKDFNKGEIKLNKVNEQMKVNFRIYLIEHLIIFLVIAAIGAYGLFDKGIDSVLLKVSLLLLTVNFIFCYLIPLMTLNSFVKDFINKILKK